MDKVTPNGKLFALVSVTLIFFSGIILFMFNKDVRKNKDITRNMILTLAERIESDQINSNIRDENISDYLKQNLSNIYNNLNKLHESDQIQKRVIIEENEKLRQLQDALMSKHGVDQYNMIDIENIKNTNGRIIDEVRQYLMSNNVQVESLKERINNLEKSNQDLGEVKRMIGVLAEAIRDNDLSRVNTRLEELNSQFKMNMEKMLQVRKEIVDEVHSGELNEIDRRLEDLVKQFSDNIRTSKDNANTIADTLKNSKLEEMRTNLFNLNSSFLTNFSALSSTIANAANSISDTTQANTNILSSQIASLPQQLQFQQLPPSIPPEEQSYTPFDNVSYFSQKNTKEYYNKHLDNFESVSNLPNELKSAITSLIY